MLQIANELPLGFVPFTRFLFLVFGITHAPCCDILTCVSFIHLIGKEEYTASGSWNFFPHTHRNHVHLSPCLKLT